MRKVILYTAISLNGKIARSNGAIDWLEAIPNPDQLDYGYKEFASSIGPTIQGHNTYKQFLTWNIAFPYSGKEHYVFTRNKKIKDDDNVRFIHTDHIEFVKNLKKKDDKDIWVIGGGQLNTMFWNAGLIDEMRVFVMPIIIPDGINLFESIPREAQLKLTKSISYSSGVVELRYGG